MKVSAKLLCLLLTVAVAALSVQVLAGPGKPSPLLTPPSLLLSVLSPCGWSEANMPHFPASRNSRGPGSVTLTSNSRNSRAQVGTRGVLSPTAPLAAMAKPGGKPRCPLQTQALFLGPSGSPQTLQTGGHSQDGSHWPPRSAVTCPHHAAGKTDCKS